MDTLPALERLSDQEKDALIVALWAEVQRLQTRLAELEAKLPAVYGRGEYDRSAANPAS